MHSRKTAPTCRTKWPRQYVSASLVVDAGASVEAPPRALIRGVRDRHVVDNPLNTNHRRCVEGVLVFGPVGHHVREASNTDVDGVLTVRGRVEFAGVLAAFDM